MKIFCDSADFKTIKKLNKNSLVSGFTTNPSLMRSAGAKNYKNYSLKLLGICKKKPISLEVFGDTYDQLVHGYGVEVKAVSYHLLEVFSGPPSRIKVILDL